MNYKLLVLDLDGTLTNSKKEITPFTTETLLQAQEKGLHLVLASGRPTYGIVPLAEELNMKQYGGFILSFNGGKVIDLMTDKVLFRTGFATRYRTCFIQPLQRSGTGYPFLQR